MPSLLLWGAFAFFVVTTLAAAVTIVMTQRKLLDGERHVNERLAEVDGTRQELVATMQLLRHESKDQQRKYERINAELEERNKQLERFAYVVSHDFKNPLITIKNYLTLIREDSDRGDAESFLRHIDRISSSADEMSRLFERLIDIHRVGWLTNTPHAVRCETVIKDALALVPTASREGVEVRIAPSLPIFVVDRTRLVEIFQILLENAVKFFGDESEPVIEIGARMEGEEVICFVADNGIGIAQRYHEKIFDLFERLDPRIEGTGTGLAMARRIVEQHHGRIWVESGGEGMGSCFCFTLPEADAQMQQARQVRLVARQGSEFDARSEDVTQTREEIERQI